MMTPEEYKKRALEQMAVAENPWDRGPQGLEELGPNNIIGGDLLSKPKQAVMDAVGPGALQSLIDLLVPSEIGMPSPASMMKKGKRVMDIIKPKTKMDELTTKGLKKWDKDTAIPEVGFKRDDPGKAARDAYKAKQAKEAALEAEKLERAKKGLINYDE